MSAMTVFFSSTLGQVVLALIVPIGWGLLSAWAFDWLRARRAKTARDGKG